MKLLTFALTIVVLAAGAVLAGRVSDDFMLAMIVTAAWFGAAGIVALLVIRASRALLLPIGAGLAVVAAAMFVLVGIPTLIGKTVDEQVVVGMPAAEAAAAAPAPNRNIERASGQFVAIAHEGRGKAAVVELADGSRKVTLTEFETDSGPDLRVYLSTADPADGPLGDTIDLGALKGNRGNQQYTVPERVDLQRFATVVVWCRAFSVPFTSAALKSL